MIAEFDVVELRRAMPQHGLVRGQAGTVVHVFTKPKTAYLVEFCNADGETIDIVTLQKSEIVVKDGALIAA